MKIVLIDDSEKRIQEMKDRIAKGGGPAKSTLAICGEDVEDLVLELRKRAQGEGASPCAVDGADLVLIDHDLSSLKGPFSMLKGAWLAQQLRTYVPCGPIIAINRWPIRTFMLRPEPNEGLSADLFFNIEDLSVTGLWKEKRGNYDPWYWPMLPQLVSNYEARWKRVKSQPAAPIPELFEVDGELQSLLPPEHPHLPTDMTAASASELGESLTDSEHIHDEQRYRIAATALGSWLNLAVIPAQADLIDAPHLIGACPSLFDGRRTRGGLAKLSTRTSEKLPIDLEVLREHEFGASYWADRPVWWTRRVMADNSIQEVHEPWSRPQLQLVFAEDLSQWIPRDDAIPYSADGRFKQRYVAGREAVGIEDLAYEPRGRLARTATPPR